jgi:hypothetical protein
VEVGRLLDVERLRLRGFDFECWRERDTGRDIEVVSIMDGAVE